MKLYSEDDWLDVGEFLRRKSNGRDPATIAQELKYALAEQIVASPIFTIRNFFYTVNKEKDLVLQDPWAGQVILDLCIESQRKRGYCQNVIEIKPRQVGWTQWGIGRVVHRSLMPRSSCLILVNDEDIAEKIMLRVNAIYNNLPKWMRPMKRIENTKSLVFDNPNAKEREHRPGLGSEILCTVPSGIRGITPNILLWSEAAFSLNPAAVVEGIFPSMGAGPNFCRIIDTTPNGRDDFYYPMVMDAIERNPKWVKSWARKEIPTRQQIIDGVIGEPDRPKGWVPAFFPAHWHPEYTTKDETPEGQLPRLTAAELNEIKVTLGKKEEYGGEEELDLVGRLGMSLYRIAWRRYTIDTVSAGADIHERLVSFRQEFATDYMSCFSSMGRGAFDMKGLEVLGRGIKPAGAVGILRQDAKNQIYCDTTFIADSIELRFWATPDPSEAYVIGVDGSNAWYSDEADYTVAQVLRRRDRKQVAIMVAKAPPHVWEEQLYLLYHWYNRAYLGIEMEGVAIDVAYRLYKRGCTHQYWYHRYDVDPMRDPSKGLGWETNRNTRWGAQNLLVRAIANRGEGGKAEPDLILRDAETYKQLLEVTRDPDGVIANHNHGHDDAFMSLMIALAINEDMWDGWKDPTKPKEPERPKVNPMIRNLGFPVGGDWDRNHPTYENL